MVVLLLFSSTTHFIPINTTATHRFLLLRVVMLLLVFCSHLLPFRLVSMVVVVLMSLLL